MWMVPSGPLRARGTRSGVVWYRSSRGMAFQSPNTAYVHGVRTIDLANQPNPDPGGPSPWSRRPPSPASASIICPLGRRRGRGDVGGRRGAVVRMHEGEARGLDRGAAVE